MGRGVFVLVDHHDDHHILVIFCRVSSHKINVPVDVVQNEDSFAFCFFIIQWAVALLKFSQRDDNRRLIIFIYRAEGE